MSSRRSWRAAVHAALLLVAMAACNEHGKPDQTAAQPTAPASPVVMLETHRGASALYGDASLVMSFSADWGKPGRIRVSRGRDPVARAFSGWPLGVAGGRAYFAVPTATDVVIERVGLVGDPEELGHIALPGQYDSVRGAVAADGTVVTEGQAKLQITANHTTTDLDVVRDTDGVGALLIRPGGNELALVTGYTHGNLASDAPRAAVTIVDLATRHVRWSVAFAQSLSAAEGEVGFVGDKLAVHLGDELAAFDIATGARSHLLAVSYVNARNVAFAPRGDAFAFVHYVHPSDIMPLSMRNGCDVYIERGEPASASGPPVAKFETGCYFGAGILWVGDELWVAPP